MNRSFSIHSLTTLAVTTLALLTGLLPAGDAAAQICLEYLEAFNYSSHNCEATPAIDRVFRLQEISWKGHDYLFVDEGNQIRIFNIDDAQDPILGSASSFSVPNVGDSDYDLLNFSVCDDCRYGVAVYKAATVLFDLGTGTTPYFTTHSQNDDASLIEGAFTFSTAGQQYLVASDLGTTPCTASESGLYEFNGVEESGNPRTQCLGGQFINGIQVSETSPQVLYMSERFGQFHIFQFNNTTHRLTDLGSGGITRASMFRGYGVDIDETAGLMAVVYAGDLTIYDVGWGTGSPTAPFLLSTLDLSQQPNANAVGLGFPVVHTGTRYTTTRPQTFDVSTPTNPVELDADFWDPSYPWNSLGDCLWNQQALFTRDGRGMFVSRYSSLQVMDPTACSGGGLNYSPASPDIGQMVLLSLTGFSGDLKVDWDFGEDGCLPDHPQEQQCLPSVFNCHQFAHKFASAGSKTVTAQVYNYDTNAYLGTVSGVINVQDVGSCDGSSCAYSINPTSRSFPSGGGKGTVSVTTQTGCSWTSFENASWIKVTSGSSGVGPGTLSYSAAPNTGEARSGIIAIAGKTHTVNQQTGPPIFEDGFESGGADAWSVAVL